jgi:hypothetical protein
LSILRTILPLATAAALAWSLQAQAAEGPDAPMATAGGSGLAPTAAPATAASVAAPPSGPERTTAQQIDDFLRSSRRESLDAHGDEPPALERGVHGEVSVGVGTHGYRSASVQAQMPLGKRGWLSVAVGESRGPWLASPCRIFADEPDEVGLLAPGGCRRGAWRGPVGAP